MIDKKPRQGENNSIPLRTDRFFAVNGYWFFTTREGSDIGPFITKEEALNGLIDFIDFIENASPMLLQQFIYNIKKSSE